MELFIRPHCPILSLLTLHYFCMQFLLVAQYTGTFNGFTNTLKSRNYSCMKNYQLLFVAGTEEASPHTDYAITKWAVHRGRIPAAPKKL